ncbi:MAG: endonuclease III domain-containing protein [Thermoplasmata archaeon]
MDLEALYERLYRRFGPQDWWPAESEFEVIVGAVLTQNTNWNNVEKAVEALKENGLMDPEKIVDTDEDELKEMIRCTGFYNQKCRRVKRVSRRILEEGGTRRYLRQDDLRNALLDIKGIGPETADSIVLYAAERPVFVVDAYTKRILKRVFGFQGTYGEVQELFHSEIDDGEERVKIFQEYHALLVELAKNYCKTRPECGGCVLKEMCLRVT